MDYPMLSIERPELEIEAKNNNKSDKKNKIEEQIELINKKFENLNNLNNNLEKKISYLEGRVCELENEVKTLKKDKKDLFEICDYLFGKDNPKIKENIKEENENIKYIINQIIMNLNPLYIKEGVKIILFNQKIKEYIDKNQNIYQEYLKLENNIFTIKDLLEFNKIKEKIKEKINSYIIHNLEELQKFKVMKKEFIWIPIESNEFHSKVNNNIYYYKYKSKFYFYFEETGKSFDINSLEEFNQDKEKTEISEMCVLAIINCLKNIEIFSRYNWENIIKPNLLNPFDYSKLSSIFQTEHNKIQKDDQYCVNVKETVFEKLDRIAGKKKFVCKFEGEFVDKKAFKTEVNKILNDITTHATDFSTYFLYHYSFYKCCKCSNCTKDKKSIKLDLGYSFIFEVDFKKLTNDNEKKRKEISIYDLLNTTCEEKMVCDRYEEDKNEDLTVERKFYECPPYLIINTYNKVLDNYNKNYYIIKFENFEDFYLDQRFCYEKPKKISHYSLFCFIMDTNGAKGSTKGNFPPYNIVAFVKNPGNEKWYKYENNNKVEIGNISDDFTDIPLLFIYKRV